MEGLPIQSRMLEADSGYILDDYIQAEQKTGNGIDDYDWEPDIKCRIIDPWVKTDTTINSDLNNDGTNDFLIKAAMCNPSMLGATCSGFSFMPLLNNKICIEPMTMWLDTIPPLDTINLNKNWTNDEALIYSHFWVINGNTSEKG